MYLTRSGKIPTKERPDTDKIYLIYQFFVHGDEKRNIELRKCLCFNVENPHIDKIFLLNEKIYDKGTLGMESDKIDQRNIGRRIKFNDIFEFVEKEKLNGYIITCNADIFLDTTVKNLRTSKMSTKKHVLTQLRFDYTNKRLGKCKLFGPRADSQDTWIFHSKYNPYKDRKIFNFMFGKPGCDNKLVYLFILIGFEVFNQPYFVKTYHIQESELRNYGCGPLPKPYMLISPNIINQQLTYTKIWGTVGERLKVTHNTTIEAMTKNFSRFMFKDDNIILRDYLKTKLEDDDEFLIPQTDKIGSVLSCVIQMINNGTKGTFFQTGQVQPAHQNAQTKYFWDIMMELQSQSKFNSTGELITFSNAYFESFNKADICMSLSTWDKKFRELMVENKHGIYKGLSDAIKTKRISSSVMNIFNYLHVDPWIEQLNGEKLLIISPYSQEIEKQIKTIKLENLYGFNIFKGCEFAYIKYDSYCTDLQEQIVNNLGDFDIALCDCGIYGPIVANYTCSIGKSAIDIGDILPLYLGLWKASDMTNYKDVMQLYFNKHWKRLI
jgi:hypothetical protein